MPLHLSGIKENVTAARTQLPPPAAQSALKPALIQSGIFHALLFAATIIGMPFIAKDPPLMLTPISIEFITPEELTQPSKPVQLPKPKTKKPKPPPPPPEPEPKAPEPEPEVAEPIPAPSSKPKPPEKPPEKPKEAPKEKAKQQERSFADLLKDITPREEEEQQSQQTEQETLDEALPDPNIRISFREAEALNAGIGACWYIDGGVRYAENLQPKLRVFVDDTLTVTRIKFLEPLRYNADPAYRAMADSASRALRNPRCNQLDLPIEKYKGKYFDFTFDPRDMLGY